MTTHDFDDERTRVRRRRRRDGIDRFADPMKRRETTDGQIGHGHVIVDGSDKTDNVQVLIGRRLILGDSIGLE